MRTLRETDFRHGDSTCSARCGSVARHRLVRAASASKACRRLVASEFTTLSICNLVNGKREVYGLPAGALSAADREAFNRHFEQHPLVRFHGYQGGRTTQRISDSVPFERFRRSALYNDYYRRIRIDHAMALPVYVRDGLLVSFVLNRTRRDFSDRERALLDLLRPHLARVYQKSQFLAIG